MQQIHQSSPTMRLLRILLVLAAANLNALSQTNATLIRTMSLEDCIDTALHHNLDIQIKRYNPEISRFALGSVYGAYDPALSFSGEHDYNQTAGGIDPQGRPFGSTQTDSDRFASALQGLLPWGTTYDLGGSIADTYGTRPAIVTDPNSPFVVTNTFFDVNAGQPVTFLSTNFSTFQTRTPFENTAGSVGFLQLRQPLLKNFWIDSTRLQIFLDKANVKISELDLRGQLMTTITA